MKIIGISGSLRQLSLHTALLRRVEDYLPEQCEFEALSIDLPLYNEDLEAGSLPATVINFRESIATSNCIIIASPEYNHSVSGPLKNAIDWASRPAFDLSLIHI